MIKDAAGNELHEGDYVVCHINKLVRLKIVKIQEPGSLSVPGKKNDMGFCSMVWVATDPIAKGQELMFNMYKSPDPAMQQLVNATADDMPSGPIPIPFKK